MSRAAFSHRIRGRDVYEAGHPVRRLLPSPEVSMVGPFVLFDHFGPARLAPGQGVRIAPHAHAHLATLTYFVSGASRHRDSLGHDVVVEAGAVAWMHAGSGITHSEETPARFRRAGGVGHGIQAWVALPEADERSAPRFQLAEAETLPELERGGVSARVLAGEAWGHRSPIETCSPLFFVEARAGDAPGELVLDALGPERAVFFVEGIGALDERRVGVGTMARLHDARPCTLRLEPGALALVFGGASLGRRYLQGNFLGSSEAILDLALGSESPPMPDPAEGA